jgi:hypothetical protein
LKTGGIEVPLTLTDRELMTLKGIQDWEKKLLAYEPNDFQLLYEKYVERSFLLLPDSVQNQFFSAVDSWLFHLHAMIQGSQLQMDAKERILSSGRIFNSDIETIEDLKYLKIEQLQYIAKQQIARHRFYSFAQGSLTGTGGALFIGMDLPAIAVINLRVVQLIAMTYGFEVNTPFEMMTSLKIFHIALLPPKVQRTGWQSLKNELEEKKDDYFYEGSEQITDISWIEQPLQQIFKALIIIFFRKKFLQGIPLFSMGVGAAANYQLTKKVTEFAHNYYQLRYLHEKEEMME